MEHGLTLVFSELQFLLSHLCEKEKEEKEKEKGRKEKGIEKERKEGRRNKKRLEERKEEGILTKIKIKSEGIKK